MSLRPLDSDRRFQFPSSLHLLLPSLLSSIDFLLQFYFAVNALDPSTGVIEGSTRVLSRIESSVSKGQLYVGDEEAPVGKGL